MQLRYVIILYKFCEWALCNCVCNYCCIIRLFLFDEWLYDALTTSWNPLSNQTKSFLVRWRDVLQSWSSQHPPPAPSMSLILHHVVKFKASSACKQLQNKDETQKNIPFLRGLSKSCCQTWFGLASRKLGNLFTVAFTEVSKNCWAWFVLKRYRSLNKHLVILVYFEGNDKHIFGGMEWLGKK